MPELAQTNVQLSRQLVALGWNDDDLVAFRRAYELDMEVLSGQFRANGKTQIDHHVGVASALAASGARPTLVLAGLTHSVYFHGEFGNGRLAVNPDKRARVQEVMGTEVEALVLAYTDAGWDLDALRPLIADADRCTPQLRDVVAMRLANEVDELADAVSRFCPERAGKELSDDTGVALLEELAAAYELDTLGVLVRDAAVQFRATDVPPALVTTSASASMVAPASLRRRFHIALQDSRFGHEVASRVPGARTLAERVRRVVS